MLICPFGIVILYNTDTGSQPSRCKVSARLKHQPASIIYMCQLISENVGLVNPHTTAVISDQ